MFSIKVCLARNKWVSSGFTSDVEDYAFVYVAAIRNVKFQLSMETVDFIPAGDGSYIIWADKECQGVLTIHEREQGGDGPD